ncbi:hypothetical protein HNP65_001848 [Thermosipho japonicus]|uniref:ABC transporter permease n=1 Tax=Thermosipho japonicus TaxID=90323 RepID=A0A841GTW9_9BACT|nr:hypothetical protein [Thermosipho japonicus]MBB6063378.1 hypothetical protein [Thermosipho japonicus]
MKKELGYFCEMNFKKPPFYFVMIFIMALFSFTLFQLFTDESIKQILASRDVARVYVTETVYVMSLSMIIMGIFANLQQILIPEKESGRIEFLLSNGFRIKSYLKSALLIMWLSGEIYLAVFLTVFFILKQRYLPKTPIADMLIIFVYITFVNLGVSAFISSVVLRIRRVAIMRFLTMTSVFAIGYGGNVLINTTVKNFQGDIFTLLLTFSLITGVGFLTLGIFFGKGVNQETVVLTIPE